MGFEESSVHRFDLGMDLFSFEKIPEKMASAISHGMILAVPGPMDEDIHHSKPFIGRGPRHPGDSV